MLMNQVFGLLRRLAARGTREVHRDDLLHRDGTRHGTNRARCRRYKLQVTSYKLQATSYKLQVTSYKLQVTSYPLRVTS